MMTAFFVKNRAVLSSSDVKYLWYKFRQHKDIQARDSLIQNYAYLVKITAGRIVSSLPRSLDGDDLISAGVIGLIKAVDQFDITRQVKFETYAIALIRGAILESLRDEDWVPRSVRDKVKMLEKACTRLETTHGRPPTGEELAMELSIRPEELQKLLMETARTTLLSIEDILVASDGGDSLNLADTLRDDRYLPYTEAQLQERKKVLASAIENLPDRERLIIALYFYEGLTYREIGKTMTISESRVYQLYLMALVRLRGYLHRDMDLFQA